MPNSNKQNRKKYSPQFKFDRSLETVKTGNLSEISRKYGVSVNILSIWRSQLLERGAQAFAASPDQEKNQLKGKIAKLEQMLGKKEVELNLLKNFSDFYESQNTT
jgi:transposase-like protein